jgi:hypothetical protein
MSLGIIWNIKGASKSKKGPTSHPPPITAKGKINEPSWVHVEPSHWLHKISIPKTSVTIVGLG